MAVVGRAGIGKSALLAKLAVMASLVGHFRFLSFSLQVY